MEGALERGNEKGLEGKIERERKRALGEVVAAIDAHFEAQKREAFEAKGREHPIADGKDAMVAHAQNLTRVTKALYEDVLRRDVYREEQATVKLLRLFEAYGKTIALFAELKKHYPDTAARIEDYLPALKAAAEHGDVMWQERQK